MGERWERMPGEGMLAFEAFCVYRDLGPSRTHEKVRRSIVNEDNNPRRKSRRQLQEWSAKWDWSARAVAYDEHLDSERRIASQKELEHKRKAMRDRHEGLAKTLTKMVLTKVFPDKNDPTKMADLGDLKLSDIPHFIKVATDLDRMVLDMPTEIIAARVGNQDNYSEVDWIDRYTQIASELGLIPDIRATKKDSGDNQAEDESLYPDNPNP